MQLYVYCHTGIAQFYNAILLIWITRTEYRRTIKVPYMPKYPISTSHTIMHTFWWSPYKTLDVCILCRRHTDKQTYKYEQWKYAGMDRLQTEQWTVRKDELIQKRSYCLENNF